MVEKWLTLHYNDFDSVRILLGMLALKRAGFPLKCIKCHPDDVRTFAEDRENIEKRGVRVETSVKMDAGRIMMVGKKRR